MLYICLFVKNHINKLYSSVKTTSSCSIELEKIAFFVENYINQLYTSLKTYPSWKRNLEDRVQLRFF
jgi:hypothetical protein